MRTVRLIVEIPNVPDWMTDDDTRAWLRDEISHPYDALYEAAVTVALVEEAGHLGAIVPPLANPERLGNGTMAYDDTYEVKD